jgi:hypothetical protein
VGVGEHSLTSDYTYNGTNFHMVIYGAVMDEILRSPAGPSVRLMMRRGERLQELAKQQVRLGHIHGGSGAGNLRDSIHVRLLATDGGGNMPIVWVGSQHPIALIHHEGTKPHMIRPVRTKALRWPGVSASGWRYATYVHHPGTAPNRYLSDNIPAAMAVS